VLSDVNEARESIQEAQRRAKLSGFSRMKLAAEDLKIEQRARALYEQQLGRSERNKRALDEREKKQASHTVKSLSVTLFFTVIAAVASAVAFKDFAAVALILTVFAVALLLVRQVGSERAPTFVCVRHSTILTAEKTCADCTTERIEGLKLEQERASAADEAQVEPEAVDVVAYHEKLDKQAEEEREVKDSLEFKDRGL
jgi:hypothetical protein